jgi:hypothetical protein
VRVHGHAGGLVEDGCAAVLIWSQNCGIQHTPETSGACATPRLAASLCRSARSVRRGCHLKV